MNVLIQRSSLGVKGSQLKSHISWIVRNAQTKARKNPFVPHSHIPYGKEGSGHYSAHNIMGYKIAETAQPLVFKALQEIPRPRGQSPFTIADYGTADGGTSMPLIESCIDEIKEKHGQQLDVMVYYEDQATNDFNSLLKRVHGLLPSSGGNAVTNAHGVYTACTGTNFFAKCFPANSINLGISFTAMHWLSKRPGVFPYNTHHVDVNDQSLLRNWRRQAKQDWESILLARAHELAPGGQMVIASVAIDDKKRYPGSTQRIKHSVFRRLNYHWFSMLEDKRITEEEYINTNFNLYFRTLDEFRAPFEEPASSVNRAGLKLVSIETCRVPCIFYAELEKGSKPIAKDAEMASIHAASLVNSIRTWSNFTFRADLSSSRSEAEKDQIVDEFYARYMNDVMSAPEDHGMDYIHAYIRIEKALSP